MKRPVARGRMLPQSLSTDPRYGRLCLKAKTLYPLLWINCDDQGRLSGDADEIKYAACPSVREIAAEDIAALCQEMEKRKLIKVYATSRTDAIQMLDWWDVQKLQWAYPSEYPPPEGWQDRLRYHASPKEIVTENWPSKAPNSLPKDLPNSLPNSLPKELESDRESSKEIKEKEGGSRRGRRILPSALGSNSTPSPTLTGLALSKFLTDTFPKGFGRKPNSREIAQLRDLGKETSAAGGATVEQVYEAFKEACDLNKLSISYVRAILLAWLGVDKKEVKGGRSPPG